LKLNLYLEPLWGTIKALEQTVITATYRPSTFTNAEAEILFKTSEFEHEPVLCKVNGNALPTNIDVRQALQRLENLKTQTAQPKKTENKDF